MRHGAARDADPTTWASDYQRPDYYYARTSPERGLYAAQPEPAYNAPTSPERGYCAQLERSSPPRPAPPLPPLPQEWLSPQVRARARPRPRPRPKVRARVAPTPTPTPNPNPTPNPRAAGLELPRRAGR